MSQALVGHVSVARADGELPVTLAGCDVLQGAMRRYARGLLTRLAIQLSAECYSPSVVILSADHDGFFLSIGEES